MSDATPRRPITMRKVVILLSIVIVAPCLYGFSVRLSRLIAVAETDPIGAFAILPVFNYITATLGFIMLMGWAMLQGMFRDIEGPKYEFLAREAYLDSLEDTDDGNGTGWNGDGPPAPPEPGASGIRRPVPRELALASPIAEGRLE